MTPATLQALRRLLFFSVDEAADLIGHVSPRSWQYWERGERTIPQDVADTLRFLVEWRAKAIETVESVTREQSRKRPIIEITSMWYATPEEWLATGRPEIYWRPQQSATAALIAKYG